LQALRDHADRLQLSCVRVVREADGHILEEGCGCVSPDGDMVLMLAWFRDAKLVVVRSDPADSKKLYILTSATVKADLRKLYDSTIDERLLSFVSFVRFKCDAGDGMHPNLAHTQVKLAMVRRRRSHQGSPSQLPKS
jgi:hypothetical protein